jgi:hypothetical protein
MNNNKQLIIVNVLCAFRGHLYTHLILWGRYQFMHLFQHPTPNLSRGPKNKNPPGLNPGIREDHRTGPTANPAIWIFAI